jgi:hypothetical protein
LQTFGRASPSPKQIVLVEIICQRQFIGADVFMSLQDEFFEHLGFRWHRLFKKVNEMRQYIGAVIALRNIFTPLCLFIQTSPNNLAVASGNGNRFFTQKLHVQVANKLRSPQYRTSRDSSVRWFFGLNHLL